MAKQNDIKNQIRQIQDKLVKAGWIQTVMEIDGAGDNGTVGVTFTAKGRRHINAFIRMHADLGDFSPEELELLYLYLKIIISISMERQFGPQPTVLPHKSARQRGR